MRSERAGKRAGKPGIRCRRRRRRRGRAIHQTRFLFSCLRRAHGRILMCIYIRREKIDCSACLTFTRAFHPFRDYLRTSRFLINYSLSRTCASTRESASQFRLFVISKLLRKVAPRRRLDVDDDGRNSNGRIRATRVRLSSISGLSPARAFRPGAFCSGTPHCVGMLR